MFHAGGGPGSELAKQAMVFMATGLNKSWSIPIGYFLIGESVTASERANLLRIAIDQVQATGAILVNTVCDGPNVHFAMLQCLGAKLKGEFSCHLDIKNSLGIPIFCFLDTPHDIKNIRNCLGDKGVLIDDKGERVKWDHVKSLHKLQESEGLTLANKLKKKSIEYKKNIMNVSTAVQTLSHSVSSAMKFCKEVLQMKEFEDSDGTAKFIEV